MKTSWLSRSLVAALAVVAITLAGAVTGCGGEAVTTSSTEAESPTTISTMPPDTITTIGSTTTSTSAEETSTTTSEVGPTTTEALSSAETRLPNGNIRGMGYIDMVWESGGTRHLSIDYAEMLTGEEAIRAAIDAGEIMPGDDLPNDYFIRNVNPQKREFVVSNSVDITTSTIRGAMDEPATWAQFKSFWDASPPEDAAHLHAMPWWIERDGDTVVRIDEQYLP